MIYRTHLVFEMDAARRAAERALRQSPDDPAAYERAVQHIKRSTDWQNPESKARALSDLVMLPRGGLDVLRKKKKDEVAARKKESEARMAAWWAGEADRKKAETATTANKGGREETLKRRAAAHGALAGAYNRPLDPERQERRFRSAVERSKNPKKRPK